MMNQLIGFGVSEDVLSATVVFTDNAVSSANLTTFTFSSRSLGAAAANRKIVVGVGGAVDTRTVSSLTIGGVSASLVVQAAATETAEMWQANVPSGTTGDIVVKWSGAQVGGCGIGVWAVYGAAAAASNTYTDTNSDPATASIDISANGVAIAYAFQRNGTAGFTCAGLTERFDEAVEAAFSIHAGASDAFASAQTGLAVSLDATNAGVRNPMMVVGTWSPA